MDRRDGEAVRRPGHKHRVQYRRLYLCTFYMLKERIPTDPPRMAGIEPDSLFDLGRR